MSPELFNPIAAGPCASLADAVVHLRRPFMPDLVQAKIQARDRDHRYAEIAYFIDARAVMDRLNLLLPGAWKDSYELIEQRQPSGPDEDALLVYRCRLTVAESSYSDVGEGADHKAAQSDALKRAAVHVGIGHCVYRTAAVRMFPGDGSHELRRSSRGSFYLDAANHGWLRSRYRHWLVSDGVAEYGLPLDHGEAARALAPALFPERFRRASANGDGNGAAKTANANATSPTGASAALPSQPAEVPATQLVPVTGQPAEPPASPQQRAAVVELGRERGFSLATVEALARCVRDTMVDRLGERGLHDVRAYLDSASGGGVTDEQLATELAGLKEAKVELEPRRERLAAWLLEREEAAAAQIAA